MELTSQKLQLALACAPLIAERWVEPISEACALYSISTLDRMAAYLAQVGHESQGLSHLSELLSYSPARLGPGIGRFTKPPVTLMTAIVLPARSA